MTAPDSLAPRNPEPGSPAAVSAIVVNWNGGALLRECLRHLAAQTIPPAKIFLVDNASTDDSLAALDAIPGLIVLPQERNLGFAAGNNVALRIAETEFVALLNPDAFPEPDWLERLLAAAARHPESAAFGSLQIAADDPDRLDGIGDRYHLSGLVWRDRYRCRLTPADRVGREIFAPCAAAALYRREALLRAGLFDEDFFCYVEDVDLGFGLRLAGHSARYVPEAVVRHVGSATTGGQQGDFPVYHGHRNLVWAFLKNMPGLLLWLLLPAHLLLNAGTILWFVLKGRGRIILKAKRDALLGLPNAWRKRREVQARRTASVRDIWRALDKRWIPRRR